MKTIVLTRNKLVKVRYNEDESDKLNDILDALITVPGMKLEDKGYRG